VACTAPCLDQEEAGGENGWSAIIAGIRLHAASQPADVESDLNAWADLLEELAQLRDRQTG
jgi:hypothetical protein